MNLQQEIKNDYNKIINEVGIPISFRDKKSGSIFNVAGIVTRRTETFTPLTGMSEPLPVCAITVAKDDFDFVIPSDIREIEVSWIDMDGQEVKQLVSKISPDYSLGRITFICMDEYL